MPDLLSLIKRAAVEAVAEAGPCNALFGTVEDESPLKVRVDDRFELENLILTDAARGVKGGDAVLLLRMQGGGKYIVLGKIV